MYKEITKELINGKEYEVITLDDFGQSQTISNTFEDVVKANGVYTLSYEKKKYGVLEVTCNDIRIPETGEKEIIKIKLIAVKALEEILKVKPNETNDK